MTDLLLVTGAGASRNLGTGNSKMPLMGEWASALCEQLETEEPGLAPACGLDPEFDGPRFEEAIGDLLQWDRVRYLEERFQPLALSGFTGAPIGKLKEARERTTDRLRRFQSALDLTLFWQFGQRAVDDGKAERAYESLLHQLDPSVFAVATTNYDRSAESALLGLGHTVVNGFVGRPTRRQVFTPSALAEGRGTGTTLLHLHGAVGWYERDGEVILDNAEEDFDPNRGTPVVLYPDPEKKPAEAAIVSELWQEFEIMVNEASSILVIGHSLHDDPLVEHLAGVGQDRPLAVSCYSRADRERVKECLPAALPFQLDFAADTELNPKVVKYLTSS
jgi:hypothetical protein